MSKLQMEFMETIEGLSDDTMRMLFRSSKAGGSSVRS